MKIEIKMTEQVKTFLLVTGISLKDAIRRRLVAVKNGKYVVTAKGNNMKQRGFL